MSWRAPLREYHNGEIIGYNVTFTATSSGEVLDIFSASNSTVIESLNPFASYIISIAAVTSAGVGPFSATVTVMTAEAGIVEYKKEHKFNFHSNNLMLCLQLLVVHLSSSMSLLLVHPPSLSPGYLHL